VYTLPLGHFDFDGGRDHRAQHRKAHHHEDEREGVIEEPAPDKLPVCFLAYQRCRFVWARGAARWLGKYNPWKG
jgi:hypothetical protein